MLMAKLREAMICFKAGRVTLPYPAAPHDPEPGFRGKITIDPDLCFGCGGCANVCPAGVILLHDDGQLARILELHWSRCTYCGRCADVCPEDAINLTQMFETATDRAEDMVISLKVFMGPCQRCGRCYPPPTVLDQMDVAGFHEAGGGRP